MSKAKALTKSADISGMTTPYLKIALLCSAFLLQCDKSTATTLWVTAYYANPGTWGHVHSLAASEIDFSVVTHAIDVFIIPRQDGNLDATTYQLTSSASASLVAAAHGAHRKALFSVTGDNTAFGPATSPLNVDTFVANLVNFKKTRGYDGIDIDWEPLVDSDGPQYANFIKKLKTALVASGGSPLLTASAYGTESVFASLQSQFDQINIMSYDQGWTGVVSWHNAALYSDGMNPGDSPDWPVSTQNRLAGFLKAGVNPAKLGLGIPFYGYMWKGVAGPRLPNLGRPSNQLEYSQIVENSAYPPEQWDGAAAVPFRVLNGTTAGFITYDNEASVAAKVKYASSIGLGGVMIWELSKAYLPSRGSAKSQPLLASIGDAMQSLGGTSSTLPQMPQALKGVATSGSRVCLSWIDGGGTKIFSILKNGAVIGTSVAPRYCPAGLSRSTAYSFSVTARNAHGQQSPPSNWILVTTPSR